MFHRCATTIASAASTIAIAIACVTTATVPAGCLLLEPVALLEPQPCECTSDRECGAGESCTPDGAGCGVCSPGPVCGTSDDCPDGEACDTIRGRCEGPPVCDGDDPAVGCRAGEQCLVLDTGACRLPPPANDCQLHPAGGAIAPGRMVIDVVGHSADGRLLPAGTAAVSVGGTVLARARDLGISGVDLDAVVLDAVCGGPDPCIVEVNATVAEARCAARYTVLSPLDGNSVRVVVVDGDLGGPVVGADVVVVAGATVVAGITDAAGVFFAPGVGSAADRVSVFAPGMDSASCLGCGAEQRVVLAHAVAASSTPAVGGTLTVSPGPGDLHFGLAGLALAGPDFRASEFFGASGTVPIDLEGVTSPGQRLPFSSGATLALGTIDIRPTFAAFGRPGVRGLWAMGAHLPLSALVDLVPSDDERRDLRLETLRVGSAAGRSGILGTVSVNPAALPSGTTSALEALMVPGDVEVVADVDVSAEVTLTFTGPLPPSTTDLLVMVGAVVPGDGLLPLGGAVISVRGDDGLLRGILPGPTAIPFAPLHDGLEGRAMRVVVIAVDADDLIDDDTLSGHRVVLPMAAPAPGRVLQLTLPAFAAPPVVRRADGSDSIVVDDVGDAAVLQFEVPRSDGGRHLVSITADPTVGPIDLSGVIDDASAVEVDLDLAGMQAVGRDDGGDTVAATADRPWDLTSRLARTARR